MHMKCTEVYVLLYKMDDAAKERYRKGKYVCTKALVERTKGQHQVVCHTNSPSSTEEKAMIT